MSEDVFDICMKVLRDVKRAREKIEAIAHLEIDEESMVLINRIKSECTKILTALERDEHED